MVGCLEGRNGLVQGPAMEDLMTWWPGHSERREAPGRRYSFMGHTCFALLLWPGLLSDIQPLNALVAESTNEYEPLWSPKNPVHESLGDILDLNHNSDLRDIAQIWIFLKSMDCPTLLLILFEILYHFFFLLWLVFFCLIWFDFDMPDDMGCKGSKRHYGSRCWLFIILFWSPISLSLSFFDLYCFILFGFILLQIKKKLKMRVRRKMKLIESIRR